MSRSRGEDMTITSVYAVFANDDEAERIGRQCVEERLAACVNILGPIRSIYRWVGAVESADEVAAVFKTTEDMANALITRISGLHCYDVPCAVGWPVEKIFEPYARWVEDNVG